jgi:hypothetical protein
MTTEEKIELDNLLDDCDRLERLLNQAKRDIPAILSLAQKIGLLDADGNIISGHRSLR